MNPALPRPGRFRQTLSGDFSGGREFSAGTSMTESRHSPPRLWPTGADRTAFLTSEEEVTQLILVRHGEPSIPPKGAPIGATFDPGLSDRGRAQARLVGERFSRDRIGAVYASPLARALETAREIARHHGIEPTLVDDLREIALFRDVPRHKSPAEFIGEQVLADVRERMAQDRKWDLYPFSESSDEFRTRSVDAMESIIAASDGGRVVVVCHSGVINAYISHVIGGDRDMLFLAAHTSVNVVLSAAGGVRALRSLNDVHHLRTTEGNFEST